MLNLLEAGLAVSTIRFLGVAAGLCLIGASKTFEPMRYRRERIKSFVLGPKMYVRTTF